DRTDVAAAGRRQALRADDVSGRQARPARRGCPAPLPPRRAFPVPLPWQRAPHVGAATAATTHWPQPTPCPPQRPRPLPPDAPRQGPPTRAPPHWPQPPPSPPQRPRPLPPHAPRHTAGIIRPTATRGYTRPPDRPRVSALPSSQLPSPMPALAITACTATTAL